MALAEAASPRPSQPTFDRKETTGMWDLVEKLLTALFTSVICPLILDYFKRRRELRDEHAQASERNGAQEETPRPPRGETAAKPFSQPAPTARYEVRRRTTARGNGGWNVNDCQDVVLVESLGRWLQRSIQFALQCAVLGVFTTTAVFWLLGYFVFKLGIGQGALGGALNDLGFDEFLFFGCSAVVATHARFYTDLDTFR